MADAELAEFTQEEQEGLVLVGEAEDFKIVDDPSFQNAAEFLVKIKQYRKRAAELTGPVVSATHAAWKAALAQQNALDGRAAEAERIIKGAMGTYEQAQEAIRAAARRQAEEAQRAADVEAKRKADEATKKLEADAETKKQADVKAAEASGDTAKAARIAAAPVVVQPVLPQAVVVLTPPAPAKPQAQGISFKDEWDFEIEDANLIPREYLTVDEKKIRGVVRALKDQAKIPGVRVIKKRGVAAKA